MSADFDYCVIGGGAVGLATALYLSRHGSVLLAEKNDLFGAETSSRNSEVIHAGLYYPAGSLKERLCLRGKDLLYDFCQRHDIPHRRTGKLIVAPAADHPQLQQLLAKGQRLGIPLQLLNQQQLQALEPAVAGKAALLSPTTGIIDSHTYMQTLAAQAGLQGAILMRRTQVQTAFTDQGIWQIKVTTDDGPYQFSAAALINSAGLHATALAQQITPAASSIPALYPCRGHYFSYTRPTPFRHLIYPLPEKNLTGLGIHATLDLGGQVRFGPDTLYLAGDNLSDYRVDPALATRFADAIQAYYPGLQAGDLQPAYAGIRPKLHPAHKPAADFIIRTTHKAPPAVQLFGIESPGLTASLAIGERVTEMLQKI